VNQLTTCQSGNEYELDVSLCTRIDIFITSTREDACGNFVFKGGSYGSLLVRCLLELF
jgi:hypothetical protein